MLEVSRKEGDYGKLVMVEWISDWRLCRDGGWHHLHGLFRDRKMLIVHHQARRVGCQGTTLEYPLSASAVAIRAT